MRKLTITVGAVAAIVLGSASWLVQAAGKTSGNPKATVTFLNGGSDNILSDGSAYVGGVGGVVAELQNGTNLLLNIVTTSNPARYLTYKYPESAKINLSGQASSSPYPCGYFPETTGVTTAVEGVKVAGYINIHSIGQMQVGEVRAIRIHFGADTGQFLWLSPHNTATGSCSSTVAAYRSNLTTWYISSDLSRLTGVTSTTPGVRFNTDDNVYEVMGTDPSWWDRPSAVSQLNAGPSLGNYVMPFALTVSCPNCPAPPRCTTATKKGCAISQ